MLTYTGGDTCPYGASDNTSIPARNYEISFEFKCNSALTGPLGNPIVDESDRCRPKFIYETVHGCPVFSATAWIRFLNQYPQFFSAFLVLFGIFAIFKGKELFEVTIGLFGAAVTFVSLMVVFSFFEMLQFLHEPDDDNLGRLLGALALSLLGGIIIGYVLFKGGCLLGVMTLGMGIGFIFGLTIYNMIFFNTGAFWLLLVLSIGGAIAFGV